MKVLISQSKTKKRLVEAFQKEGAEVVSVMDAEVKLIVPTVDEELPTFASLQKHLEPICKVMVSDQSVINICRDKTEFYRFCRRRGFAVVTTMQDDLIVKPRFGKGSRGVVRTTKEYIIQPFISWPEYSIDYFGDWSGRFVSAVPRKRLEIVNGESTKGEIDENPLLIEAAKEIAEALPLIGHNTIQCFFDGRTVLFSEINCRFGGGFWLTQHKFNTVKYLMESIQ